MDSNLKSQLSGNDGHPSEDELLLFIDGELSSNLSSYLRSHLDACWSCRVRTEKIQETISTFVDYRNQVLKSLVEPPPRNWKDFDSNLRELATRVGRPSLLANVRGALTRLFWAPNSLVTWLRTSFSAFDIPVRVRAVAAVLILSVGFALFVYFKEPPVVSASEILEHANQAQIARLRNTEQPVTYQKLEVRSKDRSANWEIWNDTNRARFRESVTDERGRHFLPVSADKTGAITLPAVLSELEQVLETNRMDRLRPLSPRSYQAWTNSLAARDEQVTRSVLPSGDSAFTLITTPTGSVERGKIAEAILVVRANDWHPKELRLRVQTENGELGYQITESAFEVVTLTTLNSEIFPEQPTEKASSSPAQVKPAASENLPDLKESSAPEVRQFATLETEVEALRLLQSVGADLGEQISVQRTGNGQLKVEGIVETDKRKSEIIAALKPVIHQPGVRVDLKTLAEALAQQQSRQQASLQSQSTIDVGSGAIAAEPELRAYFGTGESSEKAKRQYATDVLSTSRDAMRHLYALRRVSNQFSPEELRTLSPEARSKWLAMIRAHAEAYQSTTVRLRNQLQPVFFPSLRQTDVSAGQEITETAALLNAVQKLFEIGSANDRVIRSALTVSAENARTSAIKTPQFWQSLNTAERFARLIQSAR